MRVIAVANQKGGVGKTPTRQCSKCREVKPLDEFHIDSSRKSGIYPACKSCESRRRREQYAMTNHQVLIESKPCATCKGIFPAHEFKRHRTSPGGLSGVCRYCINRRVSDSRKRLKTQIFTAYGNACACCGEHRTEFLAIDHINGGGRKHRAKLKDQFSFYRFLRDNGFPKDEFRLLCHNCNQALGLYGYCPHQLEKESAA